MKNILLGVTLAVIIILGFSYLTLSFLDSNWNPVQWWIGYKIAYVIIFWYISNRAIDYLHEKL